MDDFESRYAAVPRGTIEDESGTRVTYFRRRILPSQAEHAVPRRTVDWTEMPERLDLLAASTLGDAFAFWRICDANDAMNPFDLVAECEGRLEIPSELS